MRRAVEQHFDPARIDKDRNVQEMMEGRLCVVRCDFLKVMHEAAENHRWISAAASSGGMPARQPLASSVARASAPSCSSGTGTIELPTISAIRRLSG